MDSYKNKPFLDDVPAGMCLVLMLVAAVIWGQHTMAAFGALLALIGWMRCGNVQKSLGWCWVILSLFLCFLSLWHGKTEMWGEVLLLFGSAVLLYQSLGVEGKVIAREGCLSITALLAILKVCSCYLLAAGYGTINLFPARFFGNIEEAGLFFAIGILCDKFPRRRFFSCIALGLLGSGSGFLSLGFGLFFKENWIMEVTGVILGLLWNVLPVQIWTFLVIFTFLCMSEIQKWSRKWAKKMNWIPLVVGIINPWTIGMVKNFTFGMVKSFGNFLFGNGPGDKLLYGGLVQMVVELGFILVVLFLPCLKKIWKSPAGKAWCMNLLLGACAFLPAPFLLGAACGVGGCRGNKTNGRKYFLILAVIGLLICSRYHYP